MAQLSEEIKTAIVVKLAQFEGYHTIAQELGAAHGVELTRFQIRTYDPTCPGFAAGERWRVLFFKVRRAFVDDVGSVPISHTGYRLNELQKLYDDAKAAGSILAAAKLLYQAAAETSAYQLRQVSADRDTPPISWEERRAQFEAILDQAFKARGQAH